jgi:hypothetical protein
MALNRQQARGKSGEYLRVLCAFVVKRRDSRLSRLPALGNSRNAGDEPIGQAAEVSSMRSRDPIESRLNLTLR